MSAHFAWAIDLRLPDHPPLSWAGILHGGGEPSWRGWRGCRTALWQTRREAREYLAQQQRAEGNRADGIYYWKRAVVRPVEVRVSVRRSTEPTP